MDINIQENLKTQEEDFFWRLEAPSTQTKPSKYNTWY